MTAPVATPDCESTQARVARVVQKVQAVYAGWDRHTPVERMRADWERLFGPGPRDVVCAPDALGGVPCTWVASPGVRTDRVVVYLHGGGFRIGSPRSHQALMAALSKAAGVPVLGVGYRRLPEHTYPAALEDALSVFKALVERGVAPAHTAWAGDSAGGGLAVAVLLAWADRGGAAPAAVYAMSPWTDLLAQGSSYTACAALDPLHQRPMMLGLARQYLGSHPLVPWASPMSAAPEVLAKLPPMLVQVGARETLLSDAQDLVAKVCASGGQAQCQVWDGMVHVFQQFLDDLPEAPQAVTEGGLFLAQALGLGRPAHTRELA